MSRAVKPRKRNTPRRKSGGGTLVGLFVGLVMGVLIAAGVVWYLHRTPPPFANRVPPPPPQATAAPQTPLALPGKPGDPVPQTSQPQNGDKPRFDFYKILPGNGEAVPGSKTADAGKEKDKDKEKEKDKELVSKESLYLQTGSFQSAADADNQKAKLAMMGVEASVQQVMLQDKVWYRVRLGPFKKVEDVNAMRAEMAKQGVETNVVKKD